MSLIRCENVCFGVVQESISTLDKQLLQAEYLWKAGKIREYYSKTTDIAEEIMAKPTSNNLNTVTTKLFDNVISKENKVGEVNLEVGLEDLLVTQKLASYLISNTDISIEERRINAKLLCRYLGTIRKEILPNYKPTLVMANVLPPPGTPCAIAGMSPESIADPALKAQYEASIRENRINNLMNSRQAKLRSIEWEITEQIMYYISGTFNAYDISSDYFTECIKSGNFSEREKEEIINSIK